MMDILTQDKGMMEVISLAKTVAQSKAPVLIQGAPGTGKEELAQLIHEHSSRSKGEFVMINCSSTQEGFVENELFGVDRNSAGVDAGVRTTKFEAARGGTLVFCEIAEMDLRVQSKLLKVLQDGDNDRLVGRKSLASDVRILATTHRNLSESVKQGKFREDLFNRLSVINLSIPELKNRLGDVKLLAETFIKRFAEMNRKSVSGISQEALAILSAHTWPGNVAELESVMERAVVTAQGMLIQSKDISIERRSVESPSVEAAPVVRDANDKATWLPGETLDAIERNVILEALKYHHGNRTHTAKALGISIRTLRNKLADYRKIGIFA